MGRHTLDSGNLEHIDGMRRDGGTWQNVADYYGYGSETAARRAYKHACIVRDRGRTFDVLWKPEDAIEKPAIPQVTHWEGKEQSFIPPVSRESRLVQAGGELQRVLLVPDAHIPYENVQSWALMMAAAKNFDPTIIVIIGDFGDFKAVSQYLKHPTDKTKLKWEVEQCNKRLDELDALGAKTKIFLAGNHEDRLERYLQERAPELFDFISVPALYKLGERGWEYVAYREHTTLGSLYLTHDVGTTGIGCARKALDTFMHSVVTGHSHRLQYVVEGDATGDCRVSALFGWIGDIEQVDYLSRARAARDWAQGFGIGYFNFANGVVHLVPVPIVQGTCVVEGHLYEVGKKCETW